MYMQNNDFNPGINKQNIVQSTVSLKFHGILSENYNKMVHENLQI